MKSMMEFALDYAQRGWHVFPCKQGNKAPLVGRDKDANGKYIPGTGGVKKATVDPEQIKAWWSTWPTAMIGVACGPASAIWAIDPDAPKSPGDPDGRANWAALKLKHGCPPTHTHVTPGGGQHLIFRWRADRPLTNSEGNITGTGINVRGAGGYVIAPPSRRLDGKAYEISEPLDFFNFADAPDWLYAMLRPKPREQVSNGLTLSAYRSSAHPIARIQGILNRVATTTEGDRNKVLFWGAMRVVEMVVEKEVPSTEGDRAFAALFDAALHAGLSDREIVRTLQSARARA
ncbi:bifunctional DNA primase/polymerase [Bradyrhizobium sp. BR 10289]|uniref:bifunctional DNA primase/polymerase n=1 Tax=Bradyrhizobium sp. BR 10289 TaxID=2749993 RepID=UPI001C64EB58|nr:bifunctional DNA primase/polymerase [Bradyrhizobium sp. BR 10289]MBW7968615.1 bifunctional DNA primase/polymerase [Bradyrhizobium sp. BR 10289]